MKFQEFKENVERWARVRGIYEQSTEWHQQAKALEEISEYMIANTEIDKMDAIGDIAVCIVNANRFKPVIYDDYPFKPAHSYTVADIAHHILTGAYRTAIKKLYSLALAEKLDFEECLQIAWDTIEHRKGMMVNGLYVKWDNLTIDQRMEFNRRNEMEG